MKDSFQRPLCDKKEGFNQVDFKTKCMKDKGKIGKKIAYLRERKGMTREELAKAAGMDIAVIEGIECGEYEVNMDILSNILVALDVTDLYEVRMNRAIEDAKKVFASYKAENNDIKIFGDWAVNEVGDMANISKRYFLQFSLIEDKGRAHWISHLGKKYQYDIDNFEIACEYALSKMEGIENK